MTTHTISRALDGQRARSRSATSTISPAVSRGAAAFALLLLTLLMAAPTPAQTTAFSYQGQLTEAGTGANGNYDMQFALFDTVAGGVQIGLAQVVSTVPVSNGLFTVQLDFGVNAFPGANRFVEIGVRPAGGSGFQTLAPRQQISSSPYAIRTLSAATADALSSTCTGCVQDTQIQSVAGSKVSGTIPVASVPASSGNYIQNRTTEQSNANFNISGNGRVGGNLTVDGTLNGNASGNFIQNRSTPQAGANFNVGGNGTVAGILSAGSLGVGTVTPASKLHVEGPVTIVSQGDQADALSLAIERSWVFRQEGTGAGTALKLQSVGGGGNKNFLIQTDGLVGIGTLSPTAKLDVRGDVKLGGSGQFFAPGGDENLRIVRGVISAAGSVIAGSGFQAVREDAGVYKITFTPAFTAVPAVNATADRTTVSGVSYTVTTSPVTASFTVLVVRNPEGEFNSDRDFSFIAIGPR